MKQPKIGKQAKPTTPPQPQKGGGIAATAATAFEVGVSGSKATNLPKRRITKQRI